MATKYNDFYIRATVSDPGTIPRTGIGLSSSPDIIPYGIMPVDKPVTFFTNNFNENVGKDLTYNAPNYIYLRGQNQAAGAQKGKIYAYYSPSNLLLFPSVWKDNSLFTQAGVDQSNNFVEVSSASANTPFVTPEPFVWVPAYPPPGQHFCMISRVTTDQNPNPIPNTGSFSDFAAWVAGNGGIGWRNVTVVNSGSPEILYKTNYDQEDEGGLMDIIVTATGCPIGSEVWYSSGTVLPDGNPIRIPPSKIIQNERPSTFGTQAFIPPHWQTTFSGAYRSNGGSPRPGFDVSLRVQFAPVVSSKLYALGSPVESLGLGDWKMFDPIRKMYLPHADYYRAANKAFVNGPVRPILLGSVSVRGDK